MIFSVIRRLVVTVPVLAVVSFLLFAALRALPVDPAAMSLPPTATLAELSAKRHEMGLDQPITTQYLRWVQDALHGEFGQSSALRRDAGGLVIHALPTTIELAVCAMLVVSVLGLGGGLVLFALRDSWTEGLADLGATVLMSVPEFLWALLLLLAFGVLVPVLPFMGRLDPGLSRPDVTGFLLVDAVLTGQPAVLLSALRHMVLPALALGLAFAPPMMRVLRSSLLDVYHDEYIRQARLRGLGAARILLRHALKNAVLPTLTLMGVQFGFLFGGTLLVEVIYGYAGIGNLMVDAVRNADLPVIQVVGLAYCVVVVAISLGIDVLHHWLDPRQRGR